MRVFVCVFVCVCVCVCVRGQPFAGMHHGAIFHSVLIMDERPYVAPQHEAAHPEYVALIKRCWVKDPAARPTADEVLDALVAM